MKTLSKSKGVKEKVEKIIKKQTLAIICKECNGGGYNYDKKENCKECEGTGLSEWRFGTATEQIDKLYRKEMLKEINKFTVYYRSKFSLRVDRGETKDEMQTEMIELKNITDLLSHNNL